MKFPKKLLLGLLLAPMTILTSCLDSNKNEIPDEAVISVFATYTAKSESGMTFTTGEYQGSAPITYTTPLYSQFKGEIGERYVLWFTREGNSTNPYVSGAVTLLQYNEPFTGELKYAPYDEIKNKVRPDAYCMYRHASNEYLDVTFYAPISKEPKLFDVYVDEATADAEFPDVYICYEPDVFMNSPQSFFGTFNMSSLLDRSSSRGFNLHFRSDNGYDYVQKFYSDGSKPENPVQQQ